MTRPGTWQLGLLTVLAILGLYVALVAVGAARGGREVEIVTYLDEPVDGLPEGGRVEIRGVQVGRVIGLSLAPDQRHVEVRAALSLPALEQLGLRRPGDPPHTSLEALQRGGHGGQVLRAYLAPVGITSTMVLQLDLLDAARFPPPKLDFRVPPEGYVPAVPSSLRSITLSLDRVVPAIPEYMAAGMRALDRVEAGLEGVEGPVLRADLEARLARAEAALDRLDPASIAALDSDLAGKAAQLRELSGSLAEVEATLDQPEGGLQRLEAALTKAEQQLLALDLPASARRTRELSDAGREALRGLSEALEAVRAAARGLREVSREVQALTGPMEHDPGSLFYGEHRRGEPP